MAFGEKVFGKLSIRKNVFGKMSCNLAGVVVFAPGTFTVCMVTAGLLSGATVIVVVADATG